MPHRKVADIFPKFYVLKVNDFNNIAVDSLDERIYVLKNSIVEDSFKAQGLNKVKEILNYENMTVDEKTNYQSFLYNMSNAKSTIYTAKFEGKEEGRIDGEEIGIVKSERQKH